MNKIKKSLLVFAALMTIILNTDCSGQSAKSADKANKESGGIKYKVTFIELGSVRCIPCQQMQPVMKSIKEKYGTQVNVIFHDVWTQEGSPYGQKFGIDAIPTQIFLDESGKEYFRHVGFFPEEELVEVLKQKGVN